MSVEHSFNVTIFINGLRELSFVAMIGRRGVRHSGSSESPRISGHPGNAQSSGPDGGTVMPCLSSKERP